MHGCGDAATRHCARWNSDVSQGKIALDHLRYSFVREEYIHPRILQELLGVISDRNSTVVGIDLGSANRSNRFYGDIQLSESDDRLWVFWAGENERFGYSYIATSPSGIHMAECSDWGGGSGVFQVCLVISLQSGPLPRTRTIQPISREGPHFD